MQNLNECYIITRRSREQHLGVAQLGSALEWGSRGRKFKSSHPDQSVADLIFRKFFRKHRSLVPSLRFIPLRGNASRSFAPRFSLCSKLSLFHLFPLAGLCLPLNALSHIIPRCMRPPLFGLNSSATLFLQKILSKASLTRSVAPLYSAARKCEPFIRSSFLRSTPQLSLIHSFPLAAEVGWILSSKCAVLLALSGVRRGCLYYIR